MPPELSLHDSVAGWSELPLPLTSIERAQAEQVARRLNEELRGLISLVPEGHRGASAMSRVLELDRATCQRIVATAGGSIRERDSGRDEGARSLVQLPGVQGLRQFVAAVAQRYGSADTQEQVSAARAAIDSLESLIERLAGSQRRLKARLEASADPLGSAGEMPAPADDAALREALFKSAATIVGRWSHASLDVRILRPVPENPQLTEGARCRGAIGHVARAGAVPLEFGETSSLLALDANGPAMATLDRAPASGETPGALLEQFSSRPWPRVISRSAGARVVHVLDTSENDGQPCDILLAFRSRPDAHPATQNPPVGELWWLVTYPARWLVFDVWLHRDLADRAHAALELHLWGPDVSRHGASRWSTRFPGGPRLDRLGRGLVRAATPVYSRMEEVTASVFKRLGWNPNEFEGYRCEVAYPVWRAGYCMAFDFAKKAE